MRPQNWASVVGYAVVHGYATGFAAISLQRRPLEWATVAGYAVVKGLPRVFPPLAYSGQPHARRQVPDAVAGYPKVQGVGGEG